MTAATAPRCPDVVADFGLLRISARQYDEMFAAGILSADDGAELIDGVIVRRVVGGPEQPYQMNPDHADAVEVLAELKPAFVSQGCHLRVQLPIALSDADRPHPDAAVIRGTRADVRGRHPRADEVLCVIEVADASLAGDRGAKLARYAAAAVPMYVVVNLPGRRIETFADPVPAEGRYATHAVVGPGEMLRLPTAGEATVPAFDLLPGG